MKVMMVSEYPADASAIEGGVAAAAFNLVNALIEFTDIDVTVLTFDRNHEGKDASVVQNGRLKIITCPMKKKYGLLRNFHFERRQFDHWFQSENPDVVHAQSEGLYASMAVGSAAPSVYTIHGIRLKELELNRPRIGFVRYVLGTRMIRNHHRAARHIVVINEYTRAEIDGLHTANVRLIHNAVDSHFFDLYDRDNTAPGRLLQVGGVRVRKDVKTAIKAVAKLREQGVDVVLDIVGPNEERLMGDTQNLIDTNHIKDSVHIHGMVSAEALDDYYCNADVVTMSSIEESSPISIVQGMAAGKPIVSTDVGGIREMLDEGVNGFLVPAGDHEALGERVSRLVTNRTLRSEFASASRQIALDEWSTRAVALKTYEMYKEMVNVS